MEAELVRHLLSLLERYCGAKTLAETTVGRLCVKDGQFFPRLREGSALSVRKYDQIVRWFDENWPAGAEWPAGVPRQNAEAA